MLEEEYRISEISDIIGISSNTLRYYDKIGLLKSSKKENGYRFYTEKDVWSLLDILYCKKISMSLEEISELIHVGVTREKTFKEILTSKMEAEYRMIEEHHRVIKRLSLALEDLGSIENDTGNYRVTRFPESYIVCSCHTFKEALKKWYELAAKYDGLEMSYFYRKYTYEGDELKQAGVDLILYAQARPFAVSEFQFKKTERLEPFPCVHTVIPKSLENITGIDLREMRKWAERENLVVKPEVYLSEIFNFNSDDGQRQYTTVYIPLK